MPKHTWVPCPSLSLLRDTAHSVQPPTHILSADACAGFRPLVVIRNCATNQSIGCSVNVDDVVGNNQTTNMVWEALNPHLLCVILFQTYCPNIICRNHCVSALFWNIQWLQPSKATDILHSDTNVCACPFGYQQRWDVILTRPFANYYLRYKLLP